MQDRSISIANALEILQSCMEPSISLIHFIWVHIATEILIKHCLHMDVCYGAVDPSSGLFWMMSLEENGSKQLIAIQFSVAADTSMATFRLHICTEPIFEGLTFKHGLCQRDGSSAKWNRQAKKQFNWVVIWTWTGFFDFKRNVPVSSSQRSSLRHWLGDTIKSTPLVYCISNIRNIL